MIHEAVSHQPDAAYLLVQRSLLLEQALNTAKAKINELESRLQSTGADSSTGSFLRNDPWTGRSSGDNAVPRESVIIKNYFDGRRPFSINRRL